MLEVSVLNAAVVCMQAAEEADKGGLSEEGVQDRPWH